MPLYVCLVKNLSLFYSSLKFKMLNSNGKSNPYQIANPVKTAIKFN